MRRSSHWGHWIGPAHLAGRSIIGCTLKGFIVAAVLHGFYDFVVLINPGWSLPVAATGILLLWVWRLKLLHALHLDAVNRED